MLLKVGPGERFAASTRRGKKRK